MSWIDDWPPPLRLLREASAEEAKRWALRALERVAALAGRGVVRDAAIVVGALAEAGHVDEGVWRARLVEAGRKAGHRDVQRQVEVGMSSGRARCAGDPPRSQRARSASPTVPLDAQELMRAWQSGTLTGADVWALVDDACNAIRRSRHEQGVRYLRDRHEATYHAATLAGILVACGIADRWVVDAVVEAVRAAGALSPERTVDEMISYGYAAAWKFIRDDAIWDHLVVHGWAVKS